MSGKAAIKGEVLRCPRLPFCDAIDLVGWDANLTSSLTTSSSLRPAPGIRHMFPLPPQPEGAPGVAWVYEDGPLRLCAFDNVVDNEEAKGRGESCLLPTPAKLPPGEEGDGGDDGDDDDDDPAEDSTPTKRARDAKEPKERRHCPMKVHPYPARQLAARLLAPIQECFDQHPSVGVYVLAFDKSEWVPREKGVTQRKRALDGANRIADQVACRAYDREAWWAVLEDETQSLVGPEGMQMVPPWALLRSHKRAFLRFVDELCRFIAESGEALIRIPPGRILVLDWQPTVTLAGEPLASIVTDPQWWARRRDPGTGKVLPLGMNVYGCHELLPEHANAVGEGDVAAMGYASRLSAEFPEAAGIVISRDTDLIALGAAWTATHRAEAERVWVRLGLAFVQPADESGVIPAPHARTYTTGRKAGALPCEEFLHLGRLARAVEEGLGRTLPEFVAAVGVCGNDYIPKLYGLTPATMMVAWMGLSPLTASPLVLPGTSVLHPLGYAQLVLAAYHASLAVRRGTANKPLKPAAATAWQELAALVCNKYRASTKNHMPNARRLARYYAAADWWLRYALTGWLA
jgi:hypothetical protein